MLTFSGEDADNRSVLLIGHRYQKKKDKDRRKKKLRKVQQPPSLSTSLRPVSQDADGSRGKASSATPSSHPLCHAPSAGIDAPVAEPVRGDSEGVPGRDTCSESLSNATEVVGEGTRGEGRSLSEGLDAELNRKLAPGVVAGWRHSWATAVSSDKVETAKEAVQDQDRMEGVQIPFKAAERSIGEDINGGAEGQNDVDGETDGVQDQEVRKLTLQERLRFPVKYEGIVDGLGGEGGEGEEKLS